MKNNNKWFCVGEERKCVSCGGGEEWWMMFVVCSYEGALVLALKKQNQNLLLVVQVLITTKLQQICLSTFTILLGTWVTDFPTIVPFHSSSFAHVWWCFHIDYLLQWVIKSSWLTVAPNCHLKAFLQVSLVWLEFYFICHHDNNFSHSISFQQLQYDPLPIVPLRTQVRIYKTKLYYAYNLLKRVKCTKMRFKSVMHLWSTFQPS